MYSKTRVKERTFMNVICKESTCDCGLHSSAAYNRQSSMQYEVDSVFDVLHKVKMINSTK